MQTTLNRLFPLLANLIRTRVTDRDRIELNRRRIYILPTRRGLVYAVFLLAMLLGSINYGLSLGFVLTFLLTGLGLVAMLHTYRNLAGVRIHAGGVTPVFAGDEARFHLCLEATGPRPAIGLRWRKHRLQWADLLEPGTQCIGIPVPAPQRGWLTPGRFTLFTEFPLGLFRAWSYVDFGQRALVYPQPLPSPGLSWGNDEDAQGQRNAQRDGAEDFAGLREYRQGDAPRHVAWKAASKSEALQTKQFSSPSDTRYWLDWHTLNEPIETRLSLLCGMLLEAEQTHQTYGLRLPDLEIPPGRGEPHRSRCLHALAVHGLPND